MGNPSAENLGLITCMVFIGGFFGALLAAAPADRYGRRFALQIGSFLGVVGSVMQAASPNRNVFVGGRAVLGVGLSFTTTAGPNLLTELAHPRLRGKMASMVRESCHTRLLIVLTRLVQRALVPGFHHRVMVNIWNRSSL